MLTSKQVALAALVELHIAVMHRLEEIGAAASKEFSLEKALDKMMAEWKGMCFTFVPYRDTVGSLLAISTTHCKLMFVCSHTLRVCQSSQQ